MIMVCEPICLKLGQIQDIIFSRYTTTRFEALVEISGMAEFTSFAAQTFLGRNIKDERTIMRSILATIKQSL
jgi:hypothetical protein